MCAQESPSGRVWRALFYNKYHLRGFQKLSHRHPTKIGMNDVIVGRFSNETQPFDVCGCGNVNKEDDIPVSWYRVWSHGRQYMFWVFFRVGPVLSSIMSKADFCSGSSNIGTVSLFSFLSFSIASKTITLWPVALRCLLLLSFSSGLELSLFGDNLLLYWMLCNSAYVVFSTNTLPQKQEPL